MSAKKTIVQIFGAPNSQATRAAERFFRERRIDLQVIDLNRKPMAPAEIRRFIERFGLQSLIDTESKAYAAEGIEYRKLSDSEMLQYIERHPGLLRLPLVRCADRLSIGRDESAWSGMIAP